VAAIDPPAPLPPPSQKPEPFDAAAVDARALRRLFLELPSVMGGLRSATMPGNCGLFRKRQELLHRIDLANLSASTMPALELAAPGEPLHASEQVRRARHCAGAAAALDEAWALLARAERAGDDSLGALFDDLDRIVANLECHCAGRRAVHAQGDQP
jgi:hypothetical protein